MSQHASTCLNYMKLNSDKCHLLLSGFKYEHIWAQIGKDKIWEDSEAKLLGVTIDNNLKFDCHINNICTKANQKLSILSRMRKVLSVKQRRIVFKSFFESQFKSCPLIWMFCSRKANTRINKLHERALRIVTKIILLMPGIVPGIAACTCNLAT